MDDITPEELAKVLSILTGWEFTPDELLSKAHALIVVVPDDPRRERLYLAVLRAHEAAENGSQAIRRKGRYATSSSKRHA